MTFQQLQEPSPIRIIVAGVGGGGCNAVDRMIAAGIRGVEFMAINTDQQALRLSRAPLQIGIGAETTSGLGSGGNPAVGRQAANESRTALAERLAGADMVCLAAGMGGGTGTGAVPVLAEIAREQGALTVAVVTRPFSAEGRRRQQAAEQGLRQLQAAADTLIVVPNDRLLQVAARNTTLTQAFGLADGVLRQGVQGLADTLVQRGLINVDFGDVRAIMTGGGQAVMAVGVGRGANRAVEAVRRAVHSPLLDMSIEGARGVILNITGPEDLGLLEVQAAADIVARSVDIEANIIFGAVIDPDYPPQQVKVTLIATNFSERPGGRRARFAVRRDDPAEAFNLNPASQENTLQVGGNPGA